MRRLMMIRHAMPDIPLGERWCIGRTDLPLGTVGKMQAALLPFLPELKGLPVFCSRLRRAVSTALPLCPEPLIREGLEEQDMGAWDGLSFTEIQQRFPELYAAREQNPGLMPEDAEPMGAVRKRVRAALQRCLAESDGDIVVVSHKSAIDSLTGQRPKLLHTSISVLEYTGDDSFVPVEVGRMPHPELSEAVCLALLSAAGTPEQVISHCRAVADEAMRLADSVPLALNRPLLCSAALLHDIARTQPEHASLGAAWIRTLGYPEVANLILQHHDLNFDLHNLREAVPNEAALLYLADKTTQGSEHVTLEQRFSESAKKCFTDEARRAHAARLELARAIEKSIENWNNRS